MSRAIFNKSIYALLLIFVITSCASTKDTQSDVSVRLPKVKESVLIDRINTLAQQKPNHFYTRWNVKYKDEETNISFRANIRMSVDSALQATITYANIPIYNSIITPDSVTLVDRRSNCYIKEQVSYFKRKFNVDFQHKNIEEIILGMPVSWDSDSDYRLMKDPFNYVITSSEKDDDLLIRYFMDKEAKNIDKIYIESPQDSTQIEVKYFERENIDGFDIPKSGEVVITSPKGSIFIDFKYNRVNINEPSLLYLAIPEKYNECE